MGVTPPQREDVRRSSVSLGSLGSARSLARSPFLRSCVQGHTKFVSSISWEPAHEEGALPSKRFVTGSKDGTVKVWETVRSLLTPSRPSIFAPRAHWLSRCLFLLAPSGRQAVRPVHGLPHGGGDAGRVGRAGADLLGRQVRVVAKGSLPLSRSLFVLVAHVLLTRARSSASPGTARSTCGGRPTACSFGTCRCRGISLGWTTGLGWGRVTPTRGGVRSISAFLTDRHHHHHHQDAAGPRALGQHDEPEHRLRAQERGV